MVGQNVFVGAGWRNEREIVREKSDGIKTVPENRETPIVVLRGTAR